MNIMNVGILIKISQKSKKAKNKTKSEMLSNITKTKETIRLCFLQDVIFNVFYFLFFIFFLCEFGA